MVTNTTSAQSNVSVLRQTKTDEFHKKNLALEKKAKRARLLEARAIKKQKAAERKRLAAAKKKQAAAKKKQQILARRKVVQLKLRHLAELKRSKLQIRKRLLAEKRRATAARKAAQAREKAEGARRAAQAERARRAEEVRRAEEARRAERAERARRAAEWARWAEEERIADETRWAERARRAEEIRRAEEARRAERAEQARRAAQAEQARRAAQAEQEEEAGIAGMLRVMGEVAHNPNCITKEDLSELYSDVFLKSITVNLPERAHQIFIQNSCGKYFDIDRIRENLTIDMFCEGETQEVKDLIGVWNIAVADIRDGSVPDQSFGSIFEKCPDISDSQIYQVGSLYDGYDMDRAVQIVRSARNCIRRWNNFVAAFDAYIKSVVIVNDRSCNGAEAMSINGMEDYCLLLPEVDAETDLDRSKATADKYLLSLDEEIKGLKCISCPSESGIVKQYYLIKNSVYSGASQEEKNKMDKIAIALFKEHAYMYMNHPFESSVTLSLGDARRTYAQQLLYDFRDINNYVPLVTSDTELKTETENGFYSIDVLRDCTSEEFKTSEIDYVKSKFIQYVFKAALACTTPIQNGRLGAINLYNSYNAGDRLARAFDACRGRNIEVFNSMAFTYSDYIESIESNAIHGYAIRNVEVDFNTIVQNITHDEIGQVGVLYNEHVFRYYVDKFVTFVDRVIVAAQAGRSGSIAELESLATLTGSLLQSLHHCQNGRLEGIMSTLPQFLNGADMGSLNFDKMMPVVMSIIKQDIIRNTFSFCQLDHQTNQMVLSYENATYFGAAVYCLNGRYGFGFKNEPIMMSAGRFLKNYLESHRQELYGSLMSDSDIQNFFDGAYDMNQQVYARCIQKIAKLALSPDNICSAMASERHSTLFDLLFEKYKERGGANVKPSYKPQSQAEKMQVARDMSYTFGVLTRK